MKEYHECVYIENQGRNQTHW